MEIIYFLVGAAATFIGLLLWKPDVEPEEKKGPVTYDSIDTLTFTSEFKFAPTSIMSGQEVAVASTEAFLAKFEQKDHQEFFVKPGSYDVRLKLQATFIKRPE